MKKRPYHVIGIDDNGAEIRWLLAATSSAEAEQIFLSKYKADILESKEFIFK